MSGTKAYDIAVLQNQLHRVETDITYEEEVIKLLEAQRSVTTARSNGAVERLGLRDKIMENHLFIVEADRQIAHGDVVADMGFYDMYHSYLSLHSRFDHESSAFLTLAEEVGRKQTAALHARIILAAEEAMSGQLERGVSHDGLFDMDTLESPEIIASSTVKRVELLQQSVAASSAARRATEAAKAAQRSGVADALSQRRSRREQRARREAAAAHLTQITQSASVEVLQRVVKLVIQRQRARRRELLSLEKRLSRTSGAHARELVATTRVRTEAAAAAAGARLEDVEIRLADKVNAARARRLALGRPGTRPPDSEESRERLQAEHAAMRAERTRRQMIMQQGLVQEAAAAEAGAAKDATRAAVATAVAERREERARREARATRAAAAEARRKAGLRHAIVLGILSIARGAQHEKEQLVSGIMERRNAFRSGLKDIWRRYEIDVVGRRGLRAADLRLQQSALRDAVMEQIGSKLQQLRAVASAQEHAVLDAMLADTCAATRAAEGAPDADDVSVSGGGVREQEELSYARMKLTEKLRAKRMLRSSRAGSRIGSRTGSFSFGPALSPPGAMSLDVPGQSVMAALAANNLNLGPSGLAQSALQQQQYVLQQQALVMGSTLSDITIGGRGMNSSVGGRRRAVQSTGAASSDFVTAGGRASGGQGSEAATDTLGSVLSRLGYPQVETDTLGGLELRPAATHLMTMAEAEALEATTPPHIAAAMGKARQAAAEGVEDVKVRPAHSARSTEVELAKSPYI